MTQFAPEKHKVDLSKSLNSDAESHSSGLETEFEAKIRRRAEAEKMGLIEPRVATNIKDGGNFNKKSKMTRQEY